MIKNELEYKVSQEWVQKFQRSINLMDKDEERKKNNYQRWELSRSALLCHIEKLEAEITEYEKLISHDSNTPIVLTLEDIYHLPQILIKARMAAKLSQKELAALTGFTEEQIKHFEDKDYDGASFSDVMGIFTILGIQIENGKFSVPLDTLDRTPVTIEQLLSHRNPQTEFDKQSVG